MVIDTGGPENAPEGGSSGVVVDTTKQEDRTKPHTKYVDDVITNGTTSTKRRCEKKNNT